MNAKSYGAEKRDGRDMTLDEIEETYGEGRLCFLCFEGVMERGEMGFGRDATGTIYTCSNCGAREGMGLNAETFNALDMDKVKHQHYKDMIALLESQKELSEMDKVKLHHYKDMLKMNAKTFDVEFNEWAEQEMLTHGENISFKEWAQDESEKHGDMDLEDWAEHEEESHDERYEAEDLKYMRDGDIKEIDGYRITKVMIKNFEKVKPYYHVSLPAKGRSGFIIKKGNKWSYGTDDDEIIHDGFTSPSSALEDIMKKSSDGELFSAERYWDKDTDSYREIYKHSIEVREFPKSSSVYQNGKLVKQYKGQGHFNNATAYAQKLENDYVPKSFFSENMTSKLKSPYVIGAFAIGLGIPYITSFLNSKKDK